MYVALIEVKLLAILGWQIVFDFAIVIVEFQSHEYFSFNRNLNAILWNNTISKYYIQPPIIEKSWEQITIGFFYSWFGTIISYQYQQNLPHSNFFQ